MPTDVVVSIPQVMAAAAEDFALIKSNQFGVKLKTGLADAGVILTGVAENFLQDSAEPVPPLGGGAHPAVAFNSPAESSKLALIAKLREIEEARAEGVPIWQKPPCRRCAPPLC